jgi:hypothetical protein
MKNGIIILLTIILLSCGGNKNDSKPIILKYNVGDIVYVKPDSVKVYIYKKNETYLYYNASYFDNIGKENYMITNDLQIYGY